MGRHPNFIVWAMQRTGGTSLTSLLSLMHEAETVHEPFNGPRARGEYAKDCQRISAGDPFEDIRGRNIKHCYEHCKDGFNTNLQSISASLGYLPILLYRENEPDRAESLVLAKLTKAYGADSARSVYPKLFSGEIHLPDIDIKTELRHIKRCIVKTKRLREIFEERSLPVVCYEDFFREPTSDVEARLSEFRERLSSLGLNLSSTPAFESKRHAIISGNKQNSASIAKFVGNIDAFRAAVAECLADAPADLEKAAIQDVRNL